MKTKPPTETKMGTLAVTGEGQIKVRPDVAMVDLDTVTTGKTAQEASQQNAQRMTAVVSALKALGLAGADLQTVGYTVLPMVDDDEKSPTHGKIVGYRVTSQLRAQVAVDRVGETLDTALAAGANMALGIRYTLRDEAQARTRALKAAIKAAKRDADTIAESVSVKIHGVEAIEATMGGSPVFFRALESAKAMTPIEPGTIEVSVNVRIVYRCA